jgi:hypothetical protein
MPAGCHAAEARQILGVGEERRERHTCEPCILTMRTGAILAILALRALDMVMGIESRLALLSVPGCESRS